MTEILDVAVDANGTIFDQSAKVKALMHVTGKTIPVYQFGPKQMVLDEFDITPAQYREAMEVLYETDRFFEWHKDILPGARDALLQLHEMGYNLHIISNCRGLTEPRLRRLIGKFDLPVARFVTGIDAVPKTDLYALCNVVIDNDPEHLRPIMRDYKATKPILMLPPPNGTGCDVVEVPKDLRKKIAVGRGWPEVMRHVPHPEQIAA